MSNLDYRKQLPLTSFDEEGWLKTPLFIYLCLAFMAKGLIAFIASIVSRQSGSFLNILYPEKLDLYVGIGMSIIPIALLLLLTSTKINRFIRLKKICFLLVFFQVVAEVVLQIYDLIGTYQFLYSTTFIVLFFQLILLLILLTTPIIQLYFKQLKSEKALLDE